MATVKNTIKIRQDLILFHRKIMICAGLGMQKKKLFNVFCQTFQSVHYFLSAANNIFSSSLLAF